MLQLLYLLVSHPLIRLTAILLLSLYSIYRYYQSKCNYWEKQGVQTASVGLWTRLTKPGHKWEQDLYRRYGKCFGIYELTQPVLYLSDPVLIRDVLVKDFHSFVDRRIVGTGTDPVLDNMVGNLHGDQWKRVRSLMTPSFSSGKIRQMLPLIGECLQTMDKNLRSVSTAVAANTTDGSSLLLQEGSDMKRLFGAYSMEVIIQIAFGTKVDALFDEDNPIIRNVRKFFSGYLNLRLLALFFMPSVVQWIKMKIFDLKVTQFFRDFILKIIEDRSSSSRRQQQQQRDLKTGDNIIKKRVDFLQLMLDSISTDTTDNKDIITDKVDITDSSDINSQEKYRQLSSTSMKTSVKSLSIDELISQCVLFFVAGYETTATVLSITTHLLAKNPVVQEKLYNEINEYFKHNGQKHIDDDDDDNDDHYFKHNSQKDVDYDLLFSLKYLDAVIMESMRLYPAVPFLERQASDDYTLGSTGIQIRKGQMVRIPIYAMHHDEANFPGADQFRPERFLAANNNVHHKQHDPYVYLPFGAGPRNCLGMRLAQIEAKLALAYAVNKYRFIDIGKPIEIVDSFIIMTPKKVMVRVEKR
ncbi:cytochrome P450 3A24-like [Oppia nitens]|uniref:cytochrome P450 3A24-like n=1 Tax=Oppia nitens TaxID=1686743 RepID=UPI0023DC784A|nr:cytochrome P450 3A24-like [Oppia nitens]